MYSEGGRGQVSGGWGWGDGRGRRAGDRFREEVELEEALEVQVVLQGPGAGKVVLQPGGGE